MQISETIHPTNITLFLLQVVSARFKIFAHEHESLILVEPFSNFASEV